MKGHTKYLLAGIAVTAIIADAQRMSRNDGIPPNPSYDGRYAFARLRYTVHPGDACTCPVGDGPPGGWQHDYPEGENNIMRIMTDLTSLNARIDSTAVFDADDPELMKYPLLYLSEPACWTMSDAERKGLRKYLLKGGFLIVDDFSICSGGTVRFETSRRVFEERIRSVLPEGKLIPIPMTDPALNLFLKVDPVQLTKELNRWNAGPVQMYGIYENNDPKRRLMVVANYNTVIHRSWVWEAQGLSSIAGDNEAYKLGVNYLMYGFTH
jgi:hypothetical protein